MRIGTWNLEARWGDPHRAVLTGLGCDVLLLTEVSDETTLDGFAAHFGNGVSSAGTRWAAVFSRLPLVPLPDPHPAAAAAEIGGVRFCSSVLPWPLSGAMAEYPGLDHQERLVLCLETLIASFNEEGVVWGGDWNQPLSGAMSGFSHAGRTVVAQAAEQAALQVPLADLLGRMDRQGTIDQVAVPRSWRIDGVGKAEVDPSLSDHDAYWVDCSPL